MASTGKIEAFLAEPRNVVVAGIRRDGRPHLSPNWFYWDGQRFTARPAALEPDALELDGLGLGLTAEHQASKDRVSRRSG